MLISVRILLISLLAFFIIKMPSVLAQTTTRPILPAFSEPLWQLPDWVLSVTTGSLSRKDSLLSRFYLPLPERLSSKEFEQVQSIIIPGGILDVVNKIIYLDDTANDIIALDLNNGQIIQKINNICCPIAVVDNCLIALSRTMDRQKLLSYQLVMLDSPSNTRFRASWGPVFVPDWLALPSDGDRQKFVFNVHCYRWILSLAWQASKRNMFPNPLALLIPSQAQPIALQGQITVDLKSQTILDQSAKECDPDFLAYLTVSENNIPPQVSIDSDTMAIKTFYPYLFSLLRAYPAEHNISRAGVVARRELQVKDMRTGEKLWSHTLPAAFIPLSY